MRRWLLNTFSTLAIIILIISLLAWARSYLPRNSRIDSSDGRLLIVFWEGRYTPNFNLIDPGNDVTYPGGGNLYRRLQ